jgi:hypothetical protein
MPARQQQQVGQQQQTPSVAALMPLLGYALAAVLCQVLLLLLFCRQTALFLEVPLTCYLAGQHQQALYVLLLLLLVLLLLLYVPQGELR